MSVWRICVSLGRFCHCGVLCLFGDFLFQVLTVFVQDLRVFVEVLCVFVEVLSLVVILW